MTCEHKSLCTHSGLVCICICETSTNYRFTIVVCDRFYTLVPASWQVQGYDVDRSKVSDMALAIFLEQPLTGDLTEVCNLERDTQTGLNPSYHTFSPLPRFSLSHDPRQDCRLCALHKKKLWVDAAGSGGVHRPTVRERGGVTSCLLLPRSFVFALSSTFRTYTLSALLPFHLTFSLQRAAHTIRFKFDDFSLQVFWLRSTGTFDSKANGAASTSRSCSSVYGTRRPFPVCRT